MTPTEREFRFEWIEAAIRWHQEQIMLHQNAKLDLVQDFKRLCHEVGNSILRRAS